MAQIKPVSGRRTCVLYAVILTALGLIVAGIVLVVVVRPELDQRRQTEARLAEAERHYQAGVAFQKVGDWEAAETEFKQVITLDPNYKDTQTHLTEVKTRLTESEATATAEAIALAERARADIQSTATAQAQATATAQVVAATATMNAVETHYQKGLAYINLEQWTEAQVELRAVFEVAPNYRDVQTQLAVVDSEIAKLAPTATPTPPATPKVTPTPMPEPELRISDLAVASGRDYQIEYNALQVGKLQYTDRDYIFTLLPQGYEGMTYIRTANGDKNSQGIRFLVFKVNRDVRVYVARERGLGKLPTWLATWEPTGDTLWSSCGRGGLTYDIFQKDFSAGWVELGGSYAGDHCMYSVLMLPK